MNKAADEDDRVAAQHELPFQHTPTSDHVSGVGKDARHIAEHLAARSRRRVGHAASTPSRKALT
jgi:hypothetical protein